jgi:alkylation response protein AidB-like acyl-CoA dehydrogenase
MNIVSPAPNDATTVDGVSALVPWMQQRAAQLDEAGTFPTEELAALREAGVLALPLPIDQNLSPHDVGAVADSMADVLVQVGRGSLAVGRVVEAHINARHLIARYGSHRQRARAAEDVRSGHLFALWVTDPPENWLRMSCNRDAISLDGGKMFCSAAGYATRALVTAVDELGEARMLIVELGAGEHVRPLESPLQGMRAAVTGAVDFTRYTVNRDACLGQPGDYLKEPVFSTGAWRSSAVAAGGLQSLIDQTTAQLKAAGRLDNPHQLQRLGNALVACETSRLWVRQVARIVEDHHSDPGHAIAYTGLTRIAVETACLDAMRLVQRSLGLSAFRRGNPVERICRDLGTYLRQPAPDEVLTEAAAYVSRQPSRCRT